MLCKVKDTINASFGTSMKPGLVYDVFNKIPGRVYFNIFDPKSNVYISSQYLTFSTIAYKDKDIEAKLIPLEGEELKKVGSMITELRRRHFTHYVDLRASHTLGTDPEIFATSPEGEVIPAFSYLPKKGSGSYYADGFAGEFTTCTFSCVAYGVDYIRNGLLSIHRELKNKYPSGKLVANPVMSIPQQMLDSAAVEDVQLGCMPSKNVYGLRGLQVNDGRQLPVRVSGFHVHVTTTRGTTLIEESVLQMDRMAGVISVLLLQGLEDIVRRDYYGLPGEYRTPKYGLEYRSLSGATLWHPAITHMLLQFARAAVQFVEAGIGDIWKADDDEVIECMMNLDIDAAKKIVERNRAVVERLIHHWYRDKNQPNLGGYPQNVQPSKVIVDELVYKGFAKYIELDVEKNWYLRGSWKQHSESDEVMVWRFCNKYLGEYHGKEIE